MNFVKLSIERPIGITIIWISVLVLGLFSIRFIPVDLLPAVDPPYVSVVVYYPSASPEELEDLAIKRIEENLKIVEGVEELNTFLDQGVGVVNVSFRLGISLDNAVQRLQERIEFLKRFLPADMQISVLRFSSSIFPILFMGITGKRDRASLFSIVDNDIVPRISNIQGVGGILILADSLRALNIWLYVDRMRKYGIGVQDVLQSISQHNIDTSVGKIRSGRSSLIATVKGKFKSVSDFYDMPIAQKDGLIIRLRDVADVEISGLGSTSKAFFIDGDRIDQMLLFLIGKTPGANIVKVSDLVKRELEKISESLPADIKIYSLLDFSQYIKQTITELRNNLIYAVIAVILISWIFVRGLKETFILSVSIPTSLIFTIFLMYLLKKGFNLITLSAMIISSGIVIDNAIVILEGIKRRISEGLGLKEGIIKASAELFPAILGSTATTLIVFLPIIFLQGIAFQIFVDFVVVIFISVGISLLVAVTIIPALASRLPPSQSYPLPWLEKGYEKALNWTIRNKWKVLGAVFILFVASVYSVRFLKREFIPISDTGDIRVFIYLPKKANYLWSEEVAWEVVKRIRKEIPVEYIFLRYGESQFGRSLGRAQRFSEADNLILLGFRTKIPYIEANRRLGRIFSEFADIEDFRIFSANPLNLFIFFQSKAVEIRIFGDDYIKLIKKAKELAKKLNELPYIVDAVPDFEEPYPEIQISPFYFSFVPPKFLGENLSILITGKQVGTFNWMGQDLDIYLRLKEGSFIKVEDFKNLPIKIGNSVISLGDLANFNFGFSPSEIQRLQGRRVVRVVADTSEPILTVGEKLKKFIKENLEGYDFELGGQIKEGESAFKSIIGIFGVTLFLDWSAMVVTLESLLLPFAVLFTIPLGIIGFVLSLLITSTPISIVGLISFVLLLGVVVNNGIVLLVSVEDIRKEGMSWKEAIIKGSVSRVRPVLMTSLTTILGVFPAIFGETSAFTGKSFAIPLIGGLFTSSFLVLFVLPSLYSFRKET